jgi:hypothetical protein
MTGEKLGHGSHSCTGRGLLQINGYFVLGLFIVLEKARREAGLRDGTGYAAGRCHDH